jgi:small subunit ribosomal protein S17
MNIEIQKNDQERLIRKTRIGEVISTKMAKTAVVKVVRDYRHPLYKKVVRISKKYFAHDENSAAKVGDKVLIMETKPISRLKRWRLVEILHA